MLVNRVGDMGLALGICVCFLTFKTVNYACAFAMMPVAFDKTFGFFGFEFKTLEVLSFLLF
jgi:NADH:ubiquinone oxidoreductase subunit 5 (subunit L)/multisubunit Na+/H+ antiporter MnhA subunit